MIYCFLGGIMDKWDYLCCYFAQKYNNAIQLLARAFVQVPSKNLTKELNIHYGKAKCQRYDLTGRYRPSPYWL